MTSDPPNQARKQETSAVRSLRRAGVTTGLWAWGIFAILAALVSLGLQIFVPLLSLENDQWNRSDNPHTMASVFFYGTAGVIAIIAARSSNRKRMWIAVVVAMTGILVGLYELGVFA